MQKINRERTLSALKTLPHERTDAEDKLIEQAAAILLEITDPEFVPPPEMVRAGNEALDHHTFPDRFSYKAFRDMMKEVVE